MYGPADEVLDAYYHAVDADARARGHIVAAEAPQLQSEVAV